MSRPSRMRRVNELLRETIADEIRTLKDPRIGFVTVTEVDTSPDLRNAVVYYSVLGPEEEQIETGQVLARAAPRIQAGVGRQVRLKYLPKLRFERDPSIEEGIRMHELLKGLDDEHSDGDEPS